MSDDSSPTNLVKSPASSPERKKAKLEVYPMEMKDPKDREIDQTHLLNYTTALSSFEIPTEEQLVTVDDDMFRHHPNEDVERYFRASSQWGVPAIAWNIVRPAFLWKLEFCITEFMAVEKKRKEMASAVSASASSSTSSDTEKTGEKTLEKTSETPPPVKERLSIMGHKVSLIKTTPVVFTTEDSMEFVLKKAQSFEGFPFTWQRLCELLINPMRHYNTVDKFLRAMDKVINVVTTINENGGRQYGEWEVPSSAPHHLESVFFGAVDEVEAMEMEEKQKIIETNNDEPLDMSQKASTSMPAPRVSGSSPVSFAPPSAPIVVTSPIGTQHAEEPLMEDEEMPEEPAEEEDTDKENE